MGMVTRRIPSIITCLALLCGCDPFAAGEPEQPTEGGSVQAATRPEAVPALWAKGLKAGNVLQTIALVGTDFSGSFGGAAVGRERFVACLERVAKLEIDSARFSWRNTPSGGADSASGDVDWILATPSGAYGGRATWAVSRDAAAEWHLSRWTESGSPGNWSDLCDGF